MQRNRLVGESWGEKNRNKITQNNNSKARSVAFCTLLSAENEVCKVYFVIYPQRTGTNSVIGYLSRMSSSWYTAQFCGA